MRMSQKEKEQLHAEFSILSGLHHQNIVGYYHREHLKSSQDLHLYMEYCGNGDLGKIIKDLSAKGIYAEEGFVWAIFTQIVTALYRCHYGVDPPEVGSNVMGLGNMAKPRPNEGAMMILHRDLKPENSRSTLCFLFSSPANICSLPGRRQFCQVGRFRSFKDHAATRLCIHICRHPLLYVTRDLRRRAIYPKVRYLVARCHHVRALCPRGSLQRQIPFSAGSENQGGKVLAIAQDILRRTTGCDHRLS